MTHPASVSTLLELLDVIPITLIPEFFAAKTPSNESSKIKHSSLFILKTFFYE